MCVYGNTEQPLCPSLVLTLGVLMGGPQLPVAAEETQVIG